MSNHERQSNFIGDVGSSSWRSTPVWRRSRCHSA